MRSSPKVALGILIGLTAVIAAFFNPLFTIVLLAVVLAIFFLARNLDFGLLVLVFFFPYLGLVIDFGEFEMFREIPYLKNINAPFVDLYGLILLVAWLLHLLATRPRIGDAKVREGDQGVRGISRIFSRSGIFALFPHLKSYLLFWLSGLISLLHVPSIYFGTALKYLARPFTFFYLVFFAMPISIVTNSQYRIANSQFLHHVLTVFYFTGLLSAFNGLLGLFFGAHEGFPRATPFGFFGVSPLGPNHNLLAETLIATAPAGLILARNMETWKHGNMGKWIKYGMFFQWGIALLTFARTAWIAVAVQAVVYFWLSHRAHGQSLALYAHKAKLYLVTIAIIAIGVMLVMTTFSEEVRGSTLSRLDQARIATFYFLRSPWIGQGLGTFVPTLWQTRAFLLEYGDPLEAHGIIFKLMFEQGLLGILTFGIFVGAILLRIKKSGNVPALLIAGGSITYQLLNTTYYTSKLWIPLALAIAISRIYENSHHHAKMVS